eukprot:986953-Karenia_brevis.AAC.1
MLLMRNFSADVLSVLLYFATCLWPSFPRHWVADENFDMKVFLNGLWTDRWGLPIACKKNIRNDAANVSCRACEPACGCSVTYRHMSNQRLMDETRTSVEGLAPEAMIVVATGEINHNTEHSSLNVKGKVAALLDQYGDMEYMAMREHLRNLEIPETFWPSHQQLKARRKNVKADTNRAD